MTTALAHYDATGMDLMTLGQTLARSGYFQDTREAAQAVVKVLAGAEMGIGPIAAMTGIYIVKGRVTLSANLMAAQIKRSGKYDYRITRMDDTGCTILFFQAGEQVGESTFDEADAKAAGLLSGDNWKKFPRNMYFARAMSNGAKWYCPDVFSGPVYTPDELSAAPEDSTPQLPPAPPANPMTGEVIDQPPQTNGRVSKREALEARLLETIEEARALGIDVTDADQIAGQTDADLISAGKKLRAAIDKAKQEDGLFPEPAGHVSDDADLPL
jgi:hypothetical protein